MDPNVLRLAMGTGGGAAAPNLFSWGQNDSGQLGLEDTTNRSSPNAIGTLNTWASVGGSTASLSAAKDTNNTLFAWGTNTFYALGGGSAVPTSASSPRAVSIGAVGSFVLNGLSGMAIRTNGSLWGWGYNGNGALGLNDLDNRSIAVQVGALTNWSSLGNSLNSFFSIKTDGTLWSWGGNAHGQLGLYNTTNYSSPKQIGSLTDWTFVGTGRANQFAGAIRGGRLYMWGNNDSGALGLGNTTNYSSPMQVGSLTNWAKLSMGFRFTVAIKTDGTIWSWGENDYGKTTHALKSSPTQIGSDSDWSNVACGRHHVLAVKTNGTLWSWGLNDNGQLGLGDTTNRSSPVQVGALTNWSSIGAGSKFSLATQAT